MEKVLVNYSEIGLKGKNVGFFINKLKGSIQKTCTAQNIKLISIKKDGSALLCEVESERSKIIEAFSIIIGIKYFSFIERIESNIDVLFEKIDLILEDFKERNILEISPKTKRADKEFPLNSPEINNKIRVKADKLGIRVNYKSDENKIFIKVYKEHIFISYKKYQGLAGLPVGSTGRVLVLLSGGIDSPVAAYNLMKRGCHCDFLHLHNLKSNDDVYTSKIVETIHKLNKFQYKSQLYTFPYETFEFAIMGKVVPRYELVIFKYYLLKVAEKLSEKYEYLAIANGDNLAQVASQTLENLNVVNLNINLPIFRPLLTYEKDEIVEVSRKIDTFNLSIKEYKDCCSLVAKNPMTKAKHEKFLKSVEEVNIEELVEKSIEKISSYRIKN